MMKRTVSYHSNNYDNDTAIEYVETGLYSMLNCSYTSEDPSYGTETIHFVSETVESEQRMAYDMLKRIGKYLDAFDNGTMRDLSRDIKLEYDNYGRSTLIAIESALQFITKDYKPNRWFVTIEEAGRIIGEEFVNDRCRTFHFCESDQIESNENDPDTFEGTGWYGIKRIDGFFDNSPRDLIVAVGYWGGGNCAFGYVNEEDTDTILVREEISKAICESTGGSLSDIIFLEMDEKENK